jgi:hypothetical protein
LVVRSDIEALITISALEKDQIVQRWSSRC